MHSGKWNKKKQAEQAAVTCHYLDRGIQSDCRMEVINTALNFFSQNGLRYHHQALFKNAECHHFNNSGIIGDVGKKRLTIRCFDFRSKKAFDFLRFLRCLKTSKWLPSDSESKRTQSKYSDTKTAKRRISKSQKIIKHLTSKLWNTIDYLTFRTQKMSNALL